MKRTILFSLLTDKNQQSILSLMFPKDLSNKSFAYMPANGGERTEGNNTKYADMWEKFALDAGFELVYVNNKIDSDAEREKINQSGVFCITGGNCDLVYNVRKFHYVETIMRFFTKEEYVYSGFSAGAMILTPSFKLAGIEPFAAEENAIGLTDFTALGILDFELMVHYEESQHEILQNYRKTCPNPVITLTNDDYIVLER